MEREYDGKLLIVCEGKRVSPLDFTSDSVVLLDTEELEGRRVRILKINKMRGLEVRQPRYLFTLAGARFKYISRWEWIVKPREARQKYPPADLSKDRVPTGVDGLDEILSGGWRRGSVNLFELGRGAGKSYLPLIVNPLRAFLCGGGALVSIPSGAFNPASVLWTTFWWATYAKILGEKAPSYTQKFQGWRASTLSFRQAPRRPRPT